MSHAGAPARLEVAILRKGYRTANGRAHDVLRDVTLSLRTGEICALVGPSGCGKTTVLRIIAGLDRDYEGRVTLADDRRIGMVFQEPRLLPWRTLEQNLCLAAPAASRSELERLAKALGLTDHLGNFPGEVSLGQARRAALARAFAIKPGLLLLDEPFVSLDAALAARLRDELAALVASEKMTTLLVTHDIEEAIRLTDRIVLLGGAPTTIKAEITVRHPAEGPTPESVARTKAEIDAVSGIRP